MKTIPFHIPCVGRDEEHALKAVLRSGWVTRGPRTVQFEEQFRSYVGARYALGLNSCTAGLHLALMALGIGRGDDVMVPPLTFAATANVVVHTGAMPRFVDVEWATGNINVELVGRALTKRTRAVIAVHLAGHPCALSALQALCRRRGIALIEDAAHALGASCDGRSIGTWGTASAFSFYATKNITTGEGGMVTTPYARLYKTMQILSLHGLSADAWKRYMPSAKKHYYEVVAAGFKYNMFDLQAALGSVQLKKLPHFMRLRERLWRLYDEQLAGVPGIERPSIAPHVVHARHLYMIKIDLRTVPLSRDTILEQLRQRGIHGQLHFRSLHLHPFYRRLLGCRPDAYPVARQLSESLLSLPLYPQLTTDEVRYVCDTLKDIVRTALTRRRRR